jgi:hypothetical protein
MSEFMDASGDLLSEAPADSPAAYIDVVLEGGPRNLPAELRIHRRSTDHYKIKVPYCGGYEHFERDPAASVSDGVPVVFRWTGRTRIAE